MKQCIVVCVLLFCAVLCSCKAHRYEAYQNKIVYRVFDSLEQYFFDEIKHNKQPLGVVIEIAGLDLLKEAKEKVHRYQKYRCNDTNCIYYYYSGPYDYLYKIGLVYSYKGLKEEREIFKKSNRYFGIRGRIYPIYFANIDDDFATEFKKDNTEKRIAPTKKFQNVHFIEADIFNVVYLLDDSIRGASNNYWFIYERPLERSFIRR